MKKFIQSENLTSFILAVMLVWFGLSPMPNAFGVTPPPDGGYAGFNTGEGENALRNLTTGVANAAVGWYSLFSNTDGSYNTALGAGTLVLNVGNQSTSEGIENTAVGAAALLLNTTGSYNTGIGFSALLRNTEGAFNTATGFNALAGNTTGNSNAAFGDVALGANTTGGGNTATGSEALSNNNTGGFNTATGLTALFSNDTGGSNTAMGAYALNNNIAGNNNTATGFEALFNTTGNNNTALGYSAGSNLSTGDNDIDIGYNVTGVAGEANTIRIGNTDVTDTYVRGISGATASGGTAVFVSSNGKLGTLTSSARFKDEIKPMGNASEAILGLRPVSFRYKRNIDPQRIPQFGLVAEDVEKVNADLITRDAEGRPQTVRYEQINAMLLNEFLKEHRRVEELECTVQKQAVMIAQQQKTFDSRLAEQEKGIETLSSGLQKVSAQVQMMQAAAKLVAADR